MKEFTSAIEDVLSEDEREAQIVALMAKTDDDGKSLTREEAESEVDDGEYVEFKLNGRVMRAYQPADGQLAFMLASLGRGQTADGRFAAIINIMLECLRDADRDWMESRLLTRDKSKRIGIKQIEEVFEFLTEEWFARPTQ